MNNRNYSMDLQGGLFDVPAQEKETDHFLTPQNRELLRELASRSRKSEKDAFTLRMESYFLRNAYTHNKIMSLSNSRTRILSHQVESTHRVVTAGMKRFLLADEVGLGKTVEAGLIIKELVYRHGFTRILVVAPASLLYQWQSEMKNKFNEDFHILDRKEYRRLEKEGHENPWTVYDKAICSLDFIKQERFHDALSRCSWHTVVFDEAHRLRRDEKGSTLAYTCAEIISQKSKALLLLSATPFRGKLEELYFLIKLLDEHLLGPFQTFYRDYILEGKDLSTLKKTLENVIIRRTKKEVGGFTRRMARTISFELYSDERLLYDETTEYVATEFNRALASENRATGFVMTVFQKLLDSSTTALTTALKRRRLRLEGIVEKNSQILFGDDDLDDDLEEGFLDDDPGKTIEEMRLEIDILKRLITLGDAVERDKKGEKLQELMASLINQGVEKVIIFTQFRTTQDYLAELLKEYDVVLFNGSMSGEEKEEAILRFRESAQVIIATEAGGEGRNMQFCHVLINYDLPWSPLKIEQRIGRIHRFGQKKDVLVYNFSTTDTVAERVLEVLVQKLELFEQSIGTPDILLGEFEDEINLNKLFMEMASGKKNKKEINQEVAKQMEKARADFTKLDDLTVAKHLDFNYDEYYRITMKEREWSNEKLMSFTERLMDHLPPEEQLLKKRKGSSIWTVQTPGSNAKRSGTFHSTKAMENDSMEFLAFGHPVVDRLVLRCHDEDFGGTYGELKSHSSLAPKGSSYFLTFYSAHYTGRTSWGEINTVAVPLGGSSSDECPFIEKDALELILESTEAPGLFSAYDDDIVEKTMKRLQERVQSHRRKMAQRFDLEIDPEIDRAHASFSKRIDELDEKLDIQEAQGKWNAGTMKSAISRTRNELERIRDQYRRTIQSLEQEKKIHSSVTLLGGCYITFV